MMPRTAAMRGVSRRCAIRLSFLGGAAQLSGRLSLASQGCLTLPAGEISIPNATPINTIGARIQMPSTLDEIKRGFAQPQAEYGPIDCWWWEAARLDKEKMRWQLEELHDKGVAGTWYYPRYIGDEDLACRPRYWTEEWWDLTEFAIEEHERLGMAYWFSDWTAHEFVQDRLRLESGTRPEFIGRRLTFHQEVATAPGPLSLKADADEVVIDAAAFSPAGDYLDYTTRQDLTSSVSAGELQWTAEGAGAVVTMVCIQPFDLDYINPELTSRWIAILLGTYETRFGRHIGRTVKAFGTDEWRFMQGNVLYSFALIERFRREKGYDPSAHLVGLFRDIGPLTDKIRCEYYEVMCSEVTGKFYRPFAAWLEEHNMLFTEFCPRGKTENLLEQTHHYGDFFAYMGSYHIPGNEERCLKGDRVRKFQAKLASSIAHVNGRQRVGLCAYWGSGWGHTTQENLAWTNENYAYGINLYNRHGVLYSTMAGWYEWVPPAVHFRQPYWKYWRTFAEYVSRLSYLLSQGQHRADVALVYPLSTLHANWEDRWAFNETAERFSKAMYDLAKAVYYSGIDLDFVDDTSVANARIDGDRLVIAEMPFRAVVLPPMTTIRLRTMRQIVDFHRAGGTVAAFGSLPTASDEGGRGDPALAELLQELFGISSSAGVEETLVRERAIFAPTRIDQIPAMLDRSITRDLIASQANIFHTHQIVDGLHIYYIYNHDEHRRRIELDMDAVGAPLRFDANSGQVEEVHRFERSTERTRVTLDMDSYESIPLAIDPADQRPQLLEDNLDLVVGVEEVGDSVRVSGSDAAGGAKRVRLRHDGREYGGELEVSSPPAAIELDGVWDCRLQPTMNNRWGDFRFPAADCDIGAEVRRFRYREEGPTPGDKRGWHEAALDDGDWRLVTYTHGPYWWTTGPIAVEDDGAEVAATFYRDEPLQNNTEVAGSMHRWERYRFSKKLGFESPRSEVTATELGSLVGVQPHFLRFPAIQEAGSEAVDIEATLAAPEARDPKRRESESSGERYVRYFRTSITVHREGQYTFDFGGQASLARRAWVGGDEVISVGAGKMAASCLVALGSGPQTVLLRVETDATEPLETYAIFYLGDPPAHDPLVPQLQWFDDNAPDYEVDPPGQLAVGWFRFEAPPGLRAIRLNCDAEQVEAWSNGISMRVEGGHAYPDQTLETHSVIALRVHHRKGVYEGAAFPEPPAFECGTGRIPAGDWCGFGLREYSGGVVYRRSVRLESRHLAGAIVLELGEVVATAALPFRFDITDLVQPAENEIEITVVNTLANHMSCYPTNFIYEGQMVSGLLGPARVEFHTQFEVDAVAV
jgi:hypothetical protein